MLYMMMYNNRKRKKRMNSSKTILIPLLTEKILHRYSDAEHILSIQDIQKYLEEYALSADRRTIYNAMNALSEAGMTVHRKTKDRKTGYYVSHPLKKEEVFLLNNEIASCSALSTKEACMLQKKLSHMLSNYEADALPVTSDALHANRKETHLDSIRILLDAIAGFHPVTFRYFDLNVDHSKIYRPNLYTMVPYAIVSENGRFYCIFHSEKHSSFGNYRIDKMDHISVSEERKKSVPFSLRDHLRTSFQMYHGTGQTVTCRFDRSFAGYVYDRFDLSNIIISSVDENTFTASIRTALTPTLISWFMQFSEHVTVLEPQKLQDELIASSEAIIQKYRKEGK